jgi:hypothetical protein
MCIAVATAKLFKAAFLVVITSPGCRRVHVSELPILRPLA